MEEINETGGATIGWVRMSWPFAKLTVNKNMLKLSGCLAGEFIFRPEDIISIEPNGFAFKSGIKIIHRVSSYSNNITFTGGGATYLIDSIKRTGFLDNRAPLPVDLEATIIDLQTKGAFPLKVPFAIAMVVIWNAFFIADRFYLFGNYKNNMPFGKGAPLALGFILVTAILILTGGPVRRLAMKEGRLIDPIKSFLYFLIFITFVMFVAFTVLA